MEKFKDSLERFRNIDGDNFGACLREIKDDNILLQFRQRKADSQGCWIQIFDENNGYMVFEPEQEHKFERGA